MLALRRMEDVGPNMVFLPVTLYATLNIAATGALIRPEPKR